MNCSSRINNNKKVFYYNESSGIATLDPAFAKNQSIMWAIHQIYSTLVEIDTGLHIVPSIAKNWQVSADRLTYTFNIRQGIYFHDNEAFENGKGRALTAHDIVYSFTRIQDKKTASSGAWIFNIRVDTIRPFIALIK
ncbi:MAG: ABC transporter substrate-binding protein [Bacteroidetes bacterium]|nr:ABC transporter substrate-binding protein [Bacteroidota bacterium]